jgi:phage shock protein A
MSSWDEIARAAIDSGDENFAGEVVGFVEQQLRRLS